MDATARDTATAQGDALYVTVPTQAVMGSLDACFCAVDYQYPWAQCIWQLKYTGRAAMARALADLMRHAPHIEVELERADWIVPIPISRTRLIERGFNQSMELVRFLCTDQLRHKIQRHALQRHEAHITQVGATRQERFAHLQDSFLITPPARQACIDKHVVLIDDVLTTGATLSAAAQLLRTSGAKKVSAVVFARTPPRQRQ
jgi:ComF family protein